MKKTEDNLKENEEIEESSKLMSSFLFGTPGALWVALDTTLCDLVIDTIHFAVAVDTLC